MGAIELHPRFCAGGTALGFNPDANPTTNNLTCPTTNPDPGLYGAILQPAMADQADGCDGSEPLTHLVAVAVSGALTQLSTTEDLMLQAGDRLRVRAACPAGLSDCRAQLQITATGGGTNMLVFPAAGFELITGTTVVDVDVEVPAVVVGVQSRFNFIVRSDGAGEPSLLLGNPHVVRP